MLLKRIVVAGFKSFADRVVLPIDKGITGIVGPNGSGKSNIIDAVRWVMGEQNAKNLRGEEAVDIIFSGSQKRHSLGMTEVSLVFDNTKQDGFSPPEYLHESEITLTRRLYADGTREYLINKHLCRLKDIIYFFSASGLGGRSYSMIQQGQVERILNAKPEGIRQIIEEAAGTLIFKQRELEAKRKMEKSAINLSRVHDLMSEIEERLVALQKQVDKVYEWEKLRQIFKETELALFVHNYHHFFGKHEKLKKEVAVQVDKELGVMTALAKLDAEHRDVQIKSEQTRPKLQELQEVILNIREQITRYEGQLMNSKDRQQRIFQRQENLQKDLEAEREQLERLKKNFEESETMNQHINRQKEVLSEELEEQRLQLSGLEKSYKNFRYTQTSLEEEKQEILRIFAQHKYRATHIDHTIHVHQQEQQESQKRWENFSEGKEKQTIRIQELEDSLSRGQKHLDEDLKQREEYQAQQLRRKGLIAEHQQQYEKIKSDYLEIKAEERSLQKTRQQGHCFLDKKKFLEKEAFYSSLVFLPDVLCFCENSEELSPKACQAFEAWSERFFVRDYLSLERLFAWCLRHSVDFLPVSLYKEQQIKQGDACHRFDLVPMKEFLVIPKDIDREFYMFLSNLWYFESLVVDEALYAHVDQLGVVFTASGLTLLSSNHIYFGLHEKKEGLLSIKSKLNIFFKQRQICATQLAKLQAEIDYLETKHEEENLLMGEIDVRLRDENQSIIESLTHLHHAKERKEVHAASCVSEESYQKETQEKIHKLIVEKEEIFSSQEVLQERVERLDQSLTQLISENKELESRQERGVQKRQHCEVEIAKLDMQTQVLKKDRERVSVQINMVENKLKRGFEESLTLRTEVEELHESQEELKENVAELIFERERKEVDIQQRTERFESLYAHQKQLVKEMQYIRTQEDKTKKKVGEKELDLERIKIAIQTLVSEVREKYQCHPKELLMQVQLDFNVDEAKKNIKKISEKIKNFGDINMMAVKEQKELTDRKQFVEKQCHEIERTSQLMVDAIAEIQETSKIKFIKTFNKICIEFENLFSILFPGGEAKLDLIDEEDPLNAGVEILVRLPGKKRQKMKLFSGGEKALTALSLIFALLRTKPTPFCFLDEVDAPLDEANVDRYNNVLKVLAERFQFIVITHNRRAMEVLDTLYGVTMQEPGVSKIVGVSLKRDFSKSFLHKE